MDCHAISLYRKLDVNGLLLVEFIFGVRHVHRKVKMNKQQDQKSVTQLVREATDREFIREGLETASRKLLPGSN